KKLRCNAARADHSKPGRDNYVVGQSRNRRYRSKVSPYRRDNRIAIVHDPSSTRWGIFKIALFNGRNARECIDTANINVAKLVIWIGRFCEHFIINRGNILKSPCAPLHGNIPQPLHTRALQFLIALPHAVTSPNMPTISPSSVLISASISSSGRGGS